MAYINQLTSPKKSSVTKILERPKGLIIATEDYDCFLYRDNKLCKKLYELYQYFKDNEDQQCELIVVPNKQVKVGFQIELGKPFKWFVYDDKIQTFPDEDEDAIDFVEELKKKLIAPSQDSDPKQSKSSEKNNGNTKRRRML